MFVIKVPGNVPSWVEVSQGINATDKAEIFGKLNKGDALVLKGNEELKANTKQVVNISKL